MANPLAWPLARPPIRVYTQVDNRLTFADFFAKLALWAEAHTG